MRAGRTNGESVVRACEFPRRATGELPLARPHQRRARSSIPANVPIPRTALCGRWILHRVHHQIDSSARIALFSCVVAKGRSLGLDVSPKGSHYCNIGSRACAISQPMISAFWLVEPPRPERPWWPASLSVRSNKSRRSVLLARSRATHLAGSA